MSIYKISFLYLLFPQNVLSLALYPLYNTDFSYLRGDSKSLNPILKAKLLYFYVICSSDKLSKILMEKILYFLVVAWIWIRKEEGCRNSQNHRLPTRCQCMCWNSCKNSTLPKYGYTLSSVVLLISSKTLFLKASDFVLPKHLGKISVCCCFLVLLSPPHSRHVHHVFDVLCWQLGSGIKGFPHQPGNQDVHLNGGEASPMFRAGLGRWVTK